MISSYSCSAKRLGRNNISLSNSVVINSLWGWVWVHIHQGKHSSHNEDCSWYDAGGVSPRDIYVLGTTSSISENFLFYGRMFLVGIKNQLSDFQVSCKSNDRVSLINSPPFVTFAFPFSEG